VATLQVVAVVVFMLPAHQAEQVVQVVVEQVVLPILLLVAMELLILVQVQVVVVLVEVTAVQVLS
jgi:hypothetical protein